MKIARLGVVLLLAGISLALALILLGNRQVVAQSDEGETDDQTRVHLHTVTTSIDPIAISLTTTVLSQQGLPLAGLTKQDFEITEAGQNTPQAPLVVDSVLDLGLDLVLAIDLSMHQQGDFAGVRQTAEAFRRSLKPVDRLTIIPFHNQVEEPQPSISGDFQLLHEQIESLGPKGNCTALFLAAQASIKSLDTSDMKYKGRRAIVILTNLGDNTVAEFKVAECIPDNPEETQKARQFAENSPIPIHILSFGDFVKEEQLRNLSEETGGKFYQEDTSEEMVSRVDQLLSLLRPAYRLTFQPRNPSAGEHDFTLQVPALPNQNGLIGTYHLPAGAGHLQLTANRSKLFIDIDQALIITATTATSYPLAGVTYQLADHSSQAWSGPPYFLVVEAEGIPVGSHTFVATATDQIGTRFVSSHTFTVFNRIQPQPRINVEWGQPFTIDVDIDANVDADQDSNLDRVVLLWQGDIVCDIHIQDFSFLIAPEKCYPKIKPDSGKTITSTYQIQAITKQEEATEVEINVTFHSPPPPRAKEWVGVGTILLALAHIFGLFWLVWIFYGRRQEMAGLVRHLGVHIRNSGNVPAEFQLSIENVSAGILRFQFRREINATEAQNKKRAKVELIVPQRPAQKEDTSPSNKPGQVKDEQRSHPNSTLAASNGRSEPQSANNVRGAEVVETLSYISPFRRLWSKLLQPFHRVQNQAGRVRQMARPVQPLVKTAQPGKADSSASPPDQAASPSPPDDEQPASTMPDRTQPLPTIQTQSEVQQTSWSRSPKLTTTLIQPNERASVDLFVKPTKFLVEATCFHFVVRSQPSRNGALVFDGEKIFPDSIELPKVRWWYRHFGPGLLGIVLLTLIIDILWVFWLF